MDRKIEKKKFPPKKIALILIIAAFFFAIFYYIAFGDHSSKLNVDLEKITIATVTRGEFQEFIPIIGVANPIKTIYLDAVEGGRVEEIFVEDNTLVEKSDKILRLANTSLLMDIMWR